MSFSEEFDDKALEVTLNHLKLTKNTTSLSDDQLADFGIKIIEYAGEIRDFVDNFLKNNSYKSNNSSQKLDKKELFKKVIRQHKLIYFVFYGFSQKMEWLLIFK